MGLSMQPMIRETKELMEAIEIDIDQRHISGT